MYLVFEFNEEEAGIDFYTTNSLRSVGKSSITRYFNEKDFNSILTTYSFYQKVSHLCIRDFSEIIKNNKEIPENIKNKVLLYINI